MKVVIEPRERAGTPVVDAEGPPGDPSGGHNEPGEIP